MCGVIIIVRRAKRSRVISRADTNGVKGGGRLYLPLENAFVGNEQKKVIGSTREINNILIYVKWGPRSSLYPPADSRYGRYCEVGKLVHVPMVKKPCSNDPDVSSLMVSTMSLPARFSYSSKMALSCGNERVARTELNVDSSVPHCASPGDQTEKKKSPETATEKRVLLYHFYESW